MTHMKYMIHEHDRCTSAIDKYFLFDDYDCAMSEYTKKIHAYKDFINYEWFNEVINSDSETQIDYTNEQLFLELLKDIPYFVPLDRNDYLVFVEFTSKDENTMFGRRP